DTASATSTATATPSQSSTDTPTESATTTAPASETVTTTPTSTLTVTVTETSTDTPTPTAAATGTAAASPTDTATPKPVSGDLKPGPQSTIVIESSLVRTPAPIPTVILIPRTLPHTGEGPPELPSAMGFGLAALGLLAGALRTRWPRR